MLTQSGQISHVIVNRRTNITQLFKIIDLINKLWKKRQQNEIHSVRIKKSTEIQEYEANA